MKRELNYLKEKFETNDVPLQEDFSDWMDSYWHKDEKIPTDSLNVDVSTKADKTAVNLSSENIASWKTKLNEPSQINIVTSSDIDTNKDVNGLKMNGKNVLINNGTSNINLQCLSSSSSDFICTITKTGAGTITFTEGQGITLTKITGNNLLNGDVGSRATLIRISATTYYLYLYNV